VIFVNLEGDQAGRRLATLAAGTADADGRFSLAFVTPLDLFWLNVTDVAVAAYSLKSGAQAAVPFDLLPTTAATATVPASTPRARPTATEHRRHLRRRRCHEPGARASATAPAPSTRSCAR
jgi:hypothetical protein